MSLAFASPNSDKRIELFALDADSYNLWHTWQDDNDNWTGAWDNLGRPAGTPANTYDSNNWPDLDAALDQMNRITVLRWQSNGDGVLWTVAQTAASAGWGSWTPVSSLAVNQFSPLGTVLRRQANGLLTIFGRGLASGPGLEGDVIFYIPQVRNG